MHIPETNRSGWIASIGTWSRKLNILFFSRKSSQASHEVDTIYKQLIFTLERDLLMLLLVLIPPMTILWGIETMRKALIEHSLPLNTFIVHMVNSTITWVIGMYLLRRQRITLAWGIILVMNVGTLFAQMYNLQNPGVLLFVLLPTSAPLIFASLRVNLLLQGGIILGASAMSMYALNTSRTEWVEIIVLYAGIVAGFLLIGVLIRGVVHQLARNTAEMRAEAVKRARAEQRVADLHHHVTTLATLEHDIRQPIHSIEGYLQFMQAAPNGIDTASLITAARAANQRANRLVSNLLEVARSSIQQSQHKVQTIQGADILTSIQAVTPGLARYYNEPPAAVTFAIDGTPPAVALDVEQLQRAIFNLLDNALAHTPSEGTITVHSRLDGSDWSIAVQDTGPGIPASIIQALQDNAPPLADGTRGPHLGLGLRQVYATAVAHGGTVTIDSTPHGSTVQMRLPVAPGG